MYYLFCCFTEEKRLEQAKCGGSAAQSDADPAAKENGSSTNDSAAAAKPESDGVKPDPTSTENNGDADNKDGGETAVAVKKEDQQRNSCDDLLWVRDALTAVRAAIQELSAGLIADFDNNNAPAASVIKYGANSEAVVEPPPRVTCYSPLCRTAASDDVGTLSCGSALCRQADNRDRLEAARGVHARIAAEAKDRGIEVVEAVPATRWSATADALAGLAERLAAKELELASLPEAQLMTIASDTIERTAAGDLSSSGGKPEAKNEEDGPGQKEEEEGGKLAKTDGEEEVKKEEGSEQQQQQESSTTEGGDKPAAAPEIVYSSSGIGIHFGACVAIVLILILKHIFFIY